MKELINVRNLILLAGLGQIALVLGSTYVPIALKWREQLSNVRPLTRQVFWTYAGYIFCTNLSFGILSLIGPDWLLDHSPLAGAVTIFIALYWIARVMIQFFYFDRSDAPKGLIYTLGEGALVTLFIFFSLIYSYTAFLNINGAIK